MQKSYDAIGIEHVVVLLLVHDRGATDAAVSPAVLILDEADALVLPQLAEATVDAVQVFLKILDGLNERRVLF